ncbi:MAG: plasmid stabilization protein, partial [Thaumarchaeota archaeon]|nr:plasmid stabilization protein [Nitrososphaerota archaeon]
MAKRTKAQRQAFARKAARTRRRKAAEKAKK